MSDSLRLTLSTIGSVIGIVGYIPYLLDVTRGKTKPHAFSWLIWSSVTAIAFFGQIARGGGEGTSVTAVAAVCCLIIFYAGLRKGDTVVTRFDWWCFVVALIAVPLWAFTDDPLLSMVLVTGIAGIGFLPTIRKSLVNPQQETLLLYVCSAISWILSLCALRLYSVTTMLYPLSGIILNSVVAFVIISQRRWWFRDDE